MSVLITILFCFISSIALGNLVYPYVNRCSHMCIYLCITENQSQSMR